MQVEKVLRGVSLMNTIRVGIVGLGRLGKVHAKNLAFAVPGAQLTAACSIVPAELDFAKIRHSAKKTTTDVK